MDLIIEKKQNPLNMKWGIREKPAFEFRGMSILSTINASRLSPDTWTLTEWKEYLDFLRLMNANNITIMPNCVNLYYPDDEYTHKNKWLFETWKKAMNIFKKH